MAYDNFLEGAPVALRRPGEQVRIRNLFIQPRFRHRRLAANRCASLEQMTPPT
jgi:hypothetical protein